MTVYRLYFQGVRIFYNLFILIEIIRQAEIIIAKQIIFNIL